MVAWPVGGNTCKCFRSMPFPNHALLVFQRFPDVKGLEVADNDGFVDMRPERDPYWTVESSGWNIGSCSFLSAVTTKD